MGGDGGVIASNRRYMRGAGTADSTGDYNSKNGRTHDAALVQEEAARAMVTCAISGQALDFEQAIVVCPYGRLYQKEAALEALLRRKETKELKHVRGLKDFRPVRFHLVEGSGESKGKSNKKPACPVTGRELNGTIAAYAVFPGKEGEVNVLSDKALEGEMKKLILSEYGPVETRIRLIPPPEVLEDIQAKWEKKLAEKKNKKSSTKKRKRDEGGPKSVPTTVTTNKTMAPKSDVLSSLFTSSSKNISEKERKDNLFAR